MKVLPWHFICANRGLPTFKSCPHLQDRISLLQTYFCVKLNGCAGGSRKGTIIVTSQFNLSSMCQWHSPGACSTSEEPSRR